MNVNKSKSFWVTNITNRNVSLSDLNLTVKAFSSINLLDNRHYAYTLEELTKSSLDGSLYKKSNMIVVRKVAPIITKNNNTPLLQESHLDSRQRSIYSIKEEKYEELTVSDEEFAEQNSELAESDRLGNKKV